MSSEITNPGERKLVVVSGRAHPKLAEEIAQALDHDLLPTSAYTFANARPTSVLRSRCAVRTLS